MIFSGRLKQLLRRFFRLLRRPRRRYPQALTLIVPGAFYWNAKPSEN